VSACLIHASAHTCLDDGVATKLFHYGSDLVTTQDGGGFLTRGEQGFARDLTKHCKVLALQMTIFTCSFCILPSHGVASRNKPRCISGSSRARPYFFAVRARRVQVPQSLRFLFSRVRQRTIR